jgi:hypothetical protein
MASYDAYKTTDPEPYGSAHTVDDEDRDRRWAEFMGECRDFAKSEPDGWAAVMRAVGAAMMAQGQLWQK